MHLLICTMKLGFWVKVYYKEIYIFSRSVQAHTNVTVLEKKVIEFCMRTYNKLKVC
jgi:hypothetical protein